MDDVCIKTTFWICCLKNIIQKVVLMQTSTIQWYPGKSSKNIIPNGGEFNGDLNPMVESVNKNHQQKTNPRC